MNAFTSAAARSAAASRGQVFSERRWIDRGDERALLQRDASACQIELVGSYDASTAYALPAVAALTQGRKLRGEPMSILDVGGALAFRFQIVLDTVADQPRYVGLFLGQRRELPMPNFPPQYRLQNALNLVFVRPARDSQGNT